ncbi:MAG: 16S rRNA (cytosine(1402)-N(4))-methyltransferase RsmH [Bacteroidota bacterium]
MYHRAVLLEESVSLLATKPNGSYVDVTFGGGGHSKKILSQLEGGKLIAFDRDPDAQRNLPQDDRLVFIPQDFKFLEAALNERQLAPVDGILADLGVSSHQFDTAERGFSFRFDGPLDMRMNPTQGETAADLVNTMEAEDLIALFRTYGEITNAPKLVREIVSGRTKSPIRTTSQFEHVIRNCIQPKRRAKYLAQVYQSLRIVVNGELASLENLLLASLKVLRPGGRLVIISYHSLEDRMVKYFLRSGRLDGKLQKDFYGKPLTPWKLITRKAIQPPEQEIEANPRARSARLRAATLIPEQNH